MNVTVAGRALLLTPPRTTHAGSALAPLGDYPDLYLRTVYDVLHMFRVRELEKLGVAAAEIARRKRAGGSVISAIGTPHIMYAGACGVDVPGNPNIAPEPNVSFNTGDLSTHPQCNGKALGAGDVLLTANSSADVAQAHANGCYVVGIGFPMTTNRYSPPNYNDWPGEQNSALSCAAAGHLNLLGNVSDSAAPIAEHGEHGFEDMCSIFLYLAPYNLHATHTYKCTETLCRRTC